MYRLKNGGILEFSFHKFIVFIASIAIYNEVWLRTFNEKHFKGINELKMW